MAGLFRNNEKTKEGKYLVLRRDGTVPEWQWFVLGSKDKAAPFGLRAYADAAENLGYDQQYVEDVRRLADEFEQDLVRLGTGNPDAPPHRKDDPAVIAKMGVGHSA